MRIIILFTILFYFLLIIVFHFHRCSLKHNTNVQINENKLIQNTNITQKIGNLYDEKNINTSSSRFIWRDVIDAIKKQITKRSTIENDANKKLSVKKQKNKRIKFDDIKTYIDLTLKIDKNLINENANSEKKQKLILDILVGIIKVTMPLNKNKFIQMTEIPIISLVKNLKPEELNNKNLKIAYKLLNEDIRSKRKKVLLRLRKSLIKNNNEDMAEQDKKFMD